MIHTIKMVLLSSFQLTFIENMKITIFASWNRILMKIRATAVTMKLLFNQRQG